MTRLRAGKKRSPRGSRARVPKPPLDQRVPLQVRLHPCNQSRQQNRRSSAMDPSLYLKGSSLLSRTSSVLARREMNSWAIVVCRARKPLVPIRRGRRRTHQTASASSATASRVNDVIHRFRGRPATTVSRANTYLRLTRARANTKDRVGVQVFFRSVERGEGPQFAALERCQIRRLGPVMRGTTDGGQKG